MTFVHRIPAEMTTRAWQVAVVGAGGTGSALLPNLARLHHAMLELGHPGGIDCTVYDDDTVSETNVGRQGFYPVDVGQPKATLIVNRLNNLMGTRWDAETRRIGNDDRFDCDLVIGCVDTRSARKAILDAMQRGEGGYYLDCGNESDSGQVILGQVGGPAAERLPHVGDLYPELLDPKGDKADTAPSCSMAEALQKQSLVINPVIAVQAYNLLWTLFRTGTLQYCGAFVSLATGRTSPLPLDPVAWERFGYKLSATKASAKRKPRQS
ncbi:UBA/THIF-type NAD/FAD binding fold (plasmid) [Cupriavidus sp. U2]|uniref:PRTRC system ThiF family protein n=1 Tax=Cupriavidus sp. U2 TaxID=2920269 RepID=UPI00129D56CE|nr:PRTRC system ThiF family protein [Cupriavidus sp. U2]KAI3590455.1 UBA/THIF-type NAD/FAD binding fold [Cupriavidus sp. U2]